MKKLFLSAVFGLASFACANASILGDTFQIEWWYSSANQVYSSSTAMVPGSWNPGSGVSDVTIGDGFITITNDTYGWSSASFNGFVFTDLSQDPGFTSLSLVSVTGNIPPYSPGLSYSSNSLEINFTPNGGENTGNGAGQVYTFAFTYGNRTSVPDSSASLGLLATGLLFLVTARRAMVRR